MSRGINKAILVGHIGKDPETRYSQGGTAITKVSLATTSVRKDKDGNNQETTQWHRVTFFGKIAEIAAEYLRKGSQVYVEGRISYSEHTGDDGVKKYFTDIIADGMQMLGGKGESSGQQDRSPRPQRQESARPAPPADDFSDDDIPF